MRKSRPRRSFQMVQLPKIAPLPVKIHSGNQSGNQSVLATSQNEMKRAKSAPESTPCVSKKLCSKSNRGNKSMSCSLSKNSLGVVKFGSESKSRHNSEQSKRTIKFESFKSPFKNEKLSPNHTLLSLDNSFLQLLDLNEIENGDSQQSKSSEVSGPVQLGVESELNEKNKLDVKPGHAEDFSSDIFSVSNENSSGNNLQLTESTGKIAVNINAVSERKSLLGRNVCLSAVPTVLLTPKENKDMPEKESFSECALKEIAFDLCKDGLMNRSNDSFLDLLKIQTEHSQMNNLSMGERMRRALVCNAQKPVGNPVSKRTGHSSEHLTIEVDFFGLPLLVKTLIKKFKGISSLYAWQEECLRLPAIEKHQNLVYALPTSGGKTLVAEILILKALLCREKNVVFVLPYVSLVQEKVRSLSPFAVELNFLVEEYAGGRGQYPPQKRRRKRSVYVATIEKALGLVHSLLEVGRMDEIGLVVVDELHLLGEPGRGANLEAMLVKLIYAKQEVQVVGMSATIGNLDEVARFLGAETFRGTFRPVELTEYVKVDDKLFKINVDNESPLLFHSKMKFAKSSTSGNYTALTMYTPEQKQHDPDCLGGLVSAVIPEHSCLVFCPSKKNCENVALLICKALKKDVYNHNTVEKKSLLRALKAEGNGLVCSTLKKILPYGVAYHHSGLTGAERRLLEEAFCMGTICCICCTSTLAAGVNLPAKRVILRSPYVGKEFITLSRYKQMVGRAGRAGLGSEGESFLLCKPSEAPKVGALISSSMDRCTSQLAGTGLQTLVLSSVDLGLANSRIELSRLLHASLLAVQAVGLRVDMEAALHDAVTELISTGALTEGKGDGSLQLSRLGKAAVKGNFEMSVARVLYEDLEQAQRGLVLLSHLHLLYLVTPYNILPQIIPIRDVYFTMYMKLGSKEMQTASILGVTDTCIAQMMSNRKISCVSERVVHRFYVSLLLYELWDQVSVWDISAKYQISRGLIQTLLTSAAAFAAAVIRFCEVLDEMWCFKHLLTELSEHLSHCCKSELIPLMELPAVKIGRARQLYSAGYKSLADVAKARPKVLAESLDHMPHRVAHQIVAAAKLLLLAKADSLQEQAEDMLAGVT